MTRPSAAELLAIWEQAYGQVPYQRALTFLTGTLPERTLCEILSWPIGYRDRQVAKLRAILFGTIVPSRGQCSQCLAPVEFQIDLTQCFDLHGSLPAAFKEIEYQGQQWNVRAPRSEDLLAIIRLSDNPTRALLLRCVEHVSSQEPNHEPQPWDESLIGPLEELIERLDPEAHIEMTLVCPACGHGWNAVFDIVSVFWSELNAWARRTLQEVHALASRYGWDEREILGMSPWRRSIYLGMLGAL